LACKLKPDTLAQRGLSSAGGDCPQRNEVAELRGRYESLTRRETEVMNFVVKGSLNKQIAAELGTSEVTVKLQRSQVMHKMQAGSLAELVSIRLKMPPT